MTTRNARILAILILAAAATPATASEFGCPADAPALALAQQTNERWLDAAATGRADVLADLYAENAVLMPPTDETIVGRGPIADYLAASPLPLARDGYTVDIVACELSGDTLEIAGVWGVNETGRDGSLRTVTGNIMRVANRQADGRFEVKYEIWN